MQCLSEAGNLTAASQGKRGDPRLLNQQSHSRVSLGSTLPQSRLHPGDTVTPGQTQLHPRQPQGPDQSSLPRWLLLACSPSTAHGLRGHVPHAGRGVRPPRGLRSCSLPPLPQFRVNPSGKRETPPGPAAPARNAELGRPGAPAPQKAGRASTRQCKSGSSLMAVHRQMGCLTVMLPASRRRQPPPAPQGHGPASLLSTGQRIVTSKPLCGPQVHCGRAAGSCLGASPLSACAQWGQLTQRASRPRGLPAAGAVPRG